MNKLFEITTDGKGFLYAQTESGVVLAKVVVPGEDTNAHILAAHSLVLQAFSDLAAQGYPHAYDAVPQFQQDS